MAQLYVLSFQIPNRSTLYLNFIRLQVLQFPVTSEICGGYGYLPCVEAIVLEYIGL